jgi:hypothetical protein
LVPQFVISTFITRSPAAPSTAPVLITTPGSGQVAAGGDDGGGDVGCVEAGLLRVVVGGVHGGGGVIASGSARIPHAETRRASSTTTLRTE